MSILRRLSSNPFTNWQSNTDLSDLSPQLKDEIFIWQLGATDFCRIDTSTLLRAKVVDSENYASRLLSGAQKCGIIDPVTGQPNTSKIDRDVVKSLPIVTVPNRKQLVMLLFFWEEEIMRWSLLCGEERELKARLEAGEREAGEELSFVQAKKRVRPSLRDQSGRMTQNQDDELPTYEEARRERRG